MTPTFDLNPNHLWLPLPPQAPNPARDLSQRCHINPQCATALLDYLRTHRPDTEITPIQADLWQLGLNGILFESPPHRLLCIPSSAWDLDGIHVPQEWVDIPDLCADYILAVQVNADEQLLRVWGYTTHQTLKQQGYYQPRTRTYALDREILTDNLTSLWLQQTHFPQMPLRADLPPLPSPSLDDLTQAWEILTPPQPFAHRQIPFATWAHLLTHPVPRQQTLERLYPQSAQSSSPQSSSPPATAPLVQLGRWLDHQFEPGWVAINRLINPEMVRAFMSPAIKRAKLIDLGMELRGCQVSLMMTVRATPEGMSVQASLYPTGDALTLPPQLQLRILTPTGEIFKAITSRQDDEFIRYRFEGNTGDPFSIQVVLGAACITETFQL